MCSRPQILALCFQQGFNWCTNTDSPYLQRIRIGANKQKNNRVIESWEIASESRVEWNQNWLNLVWKSEIGKVRVSVRVWVSTEQQQTSPPGQISTIHPTLLTQLAMTYDENLMWWWDGAVMVRARIMSVLFGHHGKGCKAKKVKG